MHQCKLWALLLVPVSGAMAKEFIEQQQAESRAAEEVKQPDGIYIGIHVLI